MNQTSKKIRLLSLFSLSLGIFFAADDQTVVVTVLPEIMNDLSLNVTDIDKAAWTITGYLLGYVSIMPIAGRLSDMLNKKNIYLGALILFIVGSIGTGMTNLNLEQILPTSNSNWTHSITWVIATRIFQAIGAGALIPISIAMVSDIFSTDESGLAYGILGASAEAGAIVGPIWGAVINHIWDWKTIFWLNVPVGIGIIILVYFIIPKSSNSKKETFDAVGAVLVSFAIISFTYAFSKISNSNIMFFIWCLIGIVVTLVFYFINRTNKKAIIPLDMFKNKTFISANIAHFCYGISLIIVMVTIPLMANSVLSGDSLTGGLMLTRLTVATVPGAILGGYLSNKYDLRVFCIPSLLIGTFTLLLFSQWDNTISDPYMSIQLILCGLTFGVLIAPITVAAVNNTKVEFRGAAAGIITTSRFFGMAIGMAGLTAWGADRFQHLIAGIALPLPKTGESSANFLERTKNFELDLIYAGTELFSNFFLIAAAIYFFTILPFLFVRKQP